MRGLLLLALRRLAVAALLIAPVWGIAWWYMAHTPLTYASEVFMVLPGEGSKTRVNLESVGQASSSAPSPWASSRLNPVEAYRKLLMAETVHRRAAKGRGIAPEDFPRPKIKLIDQTNFIALTLTGDSPDAARRNVQVLVDSFGRELDLLRDAYAYEREEPNRLALRAYQAKVDGARRAIVDFRARTGLMSEDQFKDRTMQVERMAKRVRDVSSELDRQDSEVATLQSALGIGATDAAQALKLRADPVFQRLLGEMSDAKIAFERARMAYGNRHPEYLKVRRAYASITDAMVDRGRIVTRNDANGFRAITDLATHGQREVMLGTLVEQSARRDGLRTQLASLRGQFATVRADMRRLSGPAAELDHLKREHQVALAVYAAALAKADTTDADRYAAYPLVQVVQVPVANPEPVSPSATIATLAAAAGTVFVLLGLAMVWLRRRILRWIGRAFAHPSAEIAAAMAPSPLPSPAVPEAPAPRTEPPMPARRALDDEPLIEIPHQTGHVTSGSYSIGGRDTRRAGRGA